MSSRKSIGKTISIIQKKKNIKIKNICNDHFSESTYFRIVNDNVETSIINFDHIIEKLNVTYDEFFFLCNQKNAQIHETLMYGIKNAFLKKDVFELQKLKKTMDNIEENFKILHLKWLCDLLIKRLERRGTLNNENRLAQYLLSIEEWTRYELVLFNNSIFSFDIDAINLIAQNVITKNSFLSSYKKNNNELFKLLINVTCCNVQNDNYKKAKEMFFKAKEICLEEEALFEKTIILFWNGIFEFYDGNEVGKKKIDNALNIFSLLGSKNLLNMHKDLYVFFKKRS